MKQDRIAYLLYQASFPSATKNQLDEILRELLNAVGDEPAAESKTGTRRRNHREWGRRDKAAERDRQRQAKEDDKAQETALQDDIAELTELFWQTRQANPGMLPFLFAAMVRLCGDHLDGHRAKIDWIHLGRKTEA